MESFVLAPQTASVPPVETIERRKLALIVEDNDAIAKLLGVILGRMGLRIHWCQTGAEALAVFAQSKDEVAFVYADCCLPDGDGRQFCLELRKADPELPLLLSSGNGTRLHAGPLKECSNLLFLPKPFAPAEVLSKVKLLRAESTRRPW